MSSVPYPSDPAVLMIQKIDALYTSLADETSPEYELYHNESLDKNIIANTPLHDAAAAGETLLAMEIATLKPSFARKLNREGLSPMHLALLNRHIETVRSLLAIEPELVRVKGKYRKTPLHYAAEMDETEVLAEFLMYCPSAINDLSSSCGSALHSAVKRRNVGACKVILGWLQKLQLSGLIYKVINWKDVDGNNVLHIAISTNQPEGSCCRRKTVILQVYVERSIKGAAIKKLSPNHHHTIKLQQGDHIIKCKHGFSIKGPHNRKADLLHYARQRFHEPTQSAPLLAREPVSSTNHQQSDPKVVSVKKNKPSNSTRTPTNCLGNNKVLALKFLTSMMKFGTKMKEKTNGGGGSFGKKMKAIVNKLKVKRSFTFLEKLHTTLKKTRS